MIYIRKCLAVLPSVPIAAFGVALFVRANLGTDPLTMVEVALANIFTSISLGTIALIFEGVVFLIFFFINRKLINFGSFAFAFGIGPCIDISTNILNKIAPPTSTIFLQTMYIIFGTIFICLALAHYIPINLGYQTSDILTLSISEWFKLSYGLSFSIVYGLLFILGLFLGGPWGLGTIIATLVFGPIIDFIKKHISRYSLKLAGIKFD